MRFRSVGCGASVFAQGLALLWLWLGLDVKNGGSSKEVVKALMLVAEGWQETHAEHQRRKTHADKANRHICVGHRFPVQTQDLQIAQQLSGCGSHLNPPHDGQDARDDHDREVDLEVQQWEKQVIHVHIEQKQRPRYVDA